MNANTISSDNSMLNLNSKSVNLEQHIVTCIFYWVDTAAGRPVVPEGIHQPSRQTCPTPMISYFIYPIQDILQYSKFENK